MVGNKRTYDRGGGQINVMVEFNKLRMTEYHEVVDIQIYSYECLCLSVVRGRGSPVHVLPGHEVHAPQVHQLPGTLQVITLYLNCIRY